MTTLSMLTQQLECAPAVLPASCQASCFFYLHGLSHTCFRVSGDAQQYKNLNVGSGTAGPDSHIEDRCFCNVSRFDMDLLDTDGQPVAGGLIDPLHTPERFASCHSKT